MLGRILRSGWRPVAHMHAPIPAVALTAEGYQMNLQEILDINVVVSPDRMDDETFIRHFNARHSDQLGGLKELPVNIGRDTLDMYRMFHDNLHEWLRMEIPHEHERL